MVAAVRQSPNGTELGLSMRADMGGPSERVGRPPFASREGGELRRIADFGSDGALDGSHFGRSLGRKRPVESILSIFRLSFAADSQRYPLARVADLGGLATRASMRSSHAAAQPHGRGRSDSRGGWFNQFADANPGSSTVGVVGAIVAQVARTERIRARSMVGSARHETKVSARASARASTKASTKAST
jgi:hypothetical protein